MKFHEFMRLVPPAQNAKVIVMKDGKFKEYNLTDNMRNGGNGKIKDLDKMDVVGVKADNNILEITVALWPGKLFVVRGSYDSNIPECIIKLEDKQQWEDAKNAMYKSEEYNDNTKSDMEIMEDYFRNNNIRYEIIELPDDSLYL